VKDEEIDCPEYPVKYFCLDNLETNAFLNLAFPRRNEEERRKTTELSAASDNKNENALIFVGVLWCLS